MSKEPSDDTSVLSKLGERMDAWVREVLSCLEAKDIEGAIALVQGCDSLALLVELEGHLKARGWGQSVGIRRLFDAIQQRRLDLSHIEEHAASGADDPAAAQNSHDGMSDAPADKDESKRRKRRL